MSMKPLINFGHRTCVANVLWTSFLVLLLQTSILYSCKSVFTSPFSRFLGAVGLRIPRVSLVCRVGFRTLHVKEQGTWLMFFLWLKKIKRFALFLFLVCWNFCMTKVPKFKKSNPQVYFSNITSQSSIPGKDTPNDHGFVCHQSTRNSSTAFLPHRNGYHRICLFLHGKDTLVWATVGGISSTLRFFLVISFCARYSCED